MKSDNPSKPIHNLAPNTYNNSIKHLTPKKNRLANKGGVEKEQRYFGRSNSTIAER